MAKTLSRRNPATFVPFDLGEVLRMFAPEIRVEEYLEDGRYTVRAELPGLDPEQDLDVTIFNHLLKLHVKRVEETHEKMRSEFRYGTFDRTVILPRGAVEESTTAAYVDGILTVTVRVAEPGMLGRHVTIGTQRPKAVRPKAA